MTRSINRRTRTPLPVIRATAPARRPSHAKVKAAALVPGAMAFGVVAMAYDALPLSIIGVIVLLAVVCAAAGMAVGR
jgi:hypothetical protein